MGNSRQGAIPSELGWLVDLLDSLQERVESLEAPSGEALNSTVPKLTALVTDIQAQLDAWAASRRTDAQTDAVIDQKIAAALAGNVTIGGALTVNGAVVMPDVYNTNITAGGGTWFATWVRNDGRVGHT